MLDFFYSAKKWDMLSFYQKSEAKPRNTCISIAIKSSAEFVGPSLWQRVGYEYKGLARRDSRSVVWGGPAYGELSGSMRAVSCWCITFMCISIAWVQPNDVSHSLQGAAECFAFTCNTILGICLYCFKIQSIPVMFYMQQLLISLESDS